MSTSPEASSLVEAKEAPTAPASPSTATEQPAPATVATGGGSVDLGTFQTAWPALVARVRDAAGPVRHALVKVATPVAVSEGKAQLEIPTHMSFHLERLQADTDLQRVMAEITVELLGVAVGIEWVGGDADAPIDMTPTDDRAPDKDRMLDEGDGSIDPADIVADLLGGEIVSE